MRRAYAEWELEDEATRLGRYEAPIDRAFAAAIKASRVLSRKEQTIEALKPGQLHLGKLRLGQDLQRERLKSERLYNKASVSDWYEVHRRIAWEARYTDPKRMVTHARIAYNLALFHMNLEHVGDAKELADLRCEAQCELANAWRVFNDHQKAWGNLLSAFQARIQGTGNEVVLARLLDVKASLHADRREFIEAHECLDQALRIYYRLRLGRCATKILVQRGIFYGRAGEFGQAVQWLHRALSRLNPNRDADLLLSARFNLASFLSDAGEHREARKHAWGLATQFEERGQRLNGAKVRWLEGKIHLELGELARAERELSAARDSFLALDDGFLAGLSTLELALLVHRRGRVKEAADLAAAALKIFVGLSIGRDALAALSFLQTVLEDRQARASRLQEMFEDFTHKLQSERTAERGKPRPSWLDP